MLYEVITQKSNARVKLGFVDFAQTDIVNAGVDVANKTVELVGGRAL